MRKGVAAAAGLFAVGLSACGPAKTENVVAEGPAAPPPLVTEVAIPVATEEPVGPDPDVELGPRKVAVAPEKAPGNLETCIRTLRDNPTAAPAEGASEYQGALADERAGTLDRARKGYFQIIQQYPASALIPAAYFAFGELFLADALKDPAKFAFAEQSYREVLKAPAPANRFYALATFRMGLSIKGSKIEESLAMFTKASKTARDYPDAACAKEVLEAAVNESVVVFAAMADEKKAWAFYSASLGKPRAANVILQLADHYIATRDGAKAANCIAANIESAAKAQSNETERTAYCGRAKEVAQRIGASSLSLQNANMSKALASACP